jgi:hypothetical protein
MMTTTYDLEIKVIAWYKHNDMAELDRLVGSWPSSLYNWISKEYKQTMRKLCTDSYQLKNIAYYYKMNDHILMDSIIAGSMSATCSYIIIEAEIH